MFDIAKQFKSKSLVWMVLESCNQYIRGGEKNFTLNN